MVSGGNAVTFNTHPAAKGVSAYCIDLINRASMEVGGPTNLMTCIKSPTIESAGALMKHRGTPLVVVTGGGGVDGFGDCMMQTICLPCRIFDVFAEVKRQSGLLAVALTHSIK